MEEHQHPFDDFLKDALKGHQLVPPENAKKAFLEEASAIIPTRKGWLKWYYLPLLVIFISGIVTVIYYSQNGTKPASSVPKVTENLSRASISDSLTSTSTPTSTIENEQITTGSTVPVENTAISVSKSFLTATDLQASSHAIQTKPEVTTGDASHKTVSVTTAIQNTPVVRDTLISKTTSAVLTLDTVSKSVTGIPDSVVQADAAVAASEAPPVAGTDSKETSKQGQADLTPYFTAGVYYLPEWMFNTLEDTKFVNNFGFEATFYRGPISIRTGAGLSVSKGVTKNAVEYNDFLGTYNKLDSITFKFNESEHNFTPNLYMSSQKVWDSISNFDSTKVVKRYTYLQIPLVLGFDFWQKGIFTAGVRVGTIMSVQVSSRQLSGEYNPGQNQVIGINMITPEQVNVNWQALGGLNVSARLRKDIFFEIEPQARYYYQSIYEKSDLAKKPWSVGVRIAVVYKF
jgi:hypothetical protein